MYNSLISYFDYLGDIEKNPGPPKRQEKKKEPTKEEIMKALQDKVKSSETKQ